MANSGGSRGGAKGAGALPLGPLDTIFQRYDVCAPGPVEYSTETTEAPRACRSRATIQVSCRSDREPVMTVRDRLPNECEKALTVWTYDSSFLGTPEGKL